MGKEFAKCLNSEYTIERCIILFWPRRDYNWLMPTFSEYKWYFNHALLAASKRMNIDDFFNTLCAEYKSTVDPVGCFLNS